MTIKEPEKQILNDFEHKVTGKINKYKEQPNFPKLSDYSIDQQDFDGYLFDKQAILDMGGSKRSQLTVGGVITVLPVLVLSAFPDDSSVYEMGKMWATVAALLVGLLIALLWKAVVQMIVHYRLAKMKDTKMEAYIKAVLFYEPR